MAAELDLQQKKTVKRPKTEEAGKKSHIPSSSAVDSSAMLTASTSRSTPSKKGLSLFLVMLIPKSGDSAQKYMQGSRSKRIDNWILLDNYVQGRSVSTGSRARALQIHSKCSKKHIDQAKKKKEKKSMDCLICPKISIGEICVAQHMVATKNRLAQCLVTADLHGAIMSVAECKVTSYTGVGDYLAWGQTHFKKLEFVIVSSDFFTVYMGYKKI
ncbi:ribonuclease P family protein [Prunus dulcis]|uniref:Ribonuclease P family protein n=1 Tax=Prunus dulcis TaxID=3755 RepID=A0A4Y1RQ48_PRUDU|nr:ribonuclease P family protein [Prunus dulcis]